MKKLITLLLCFLIMFCITFSTGCVPNNQNIELADIDKTFEDDYPLLQQVTDYLTSLSKTLHVDMIVIRNTHDPMVVGYGEKLPIEDAEFKEKLDILFEKGYIYISLSRNIVRFDRWKKMLEPSYRSGFAYSVYNEKELDIPNIISQKELSVSNWYYFEEDYEEWRLKKDTTSTTNK